MKSQAFQMPISKAGISDTVLFLYKATLRS